MMPDPADPRVVNRRSERTKPSTCVLPVLLTVAVFLSVGATPAPASTVNWVAPGSGDWNSPSNWSDGTVPNDGSPPGTFYSVNIIGTGSDTITFNAPTPTTIDSLTLGTGETFTDAGVARSLTLGSTNAPGSLTNAGNINFSASTLTIDISSLAGGPGVLVTQTNTGTIVIGNGPVNLGAALFLDDGGKKNGINLVGGGTITLRDAIIAANATAALVNTDNTIQGNGFINADFKNSGTVIASGGMGTIPLILTPSGASTNPGVVNTSNGTMQVMSGNGLVLDFGSYGGTSLTLPGFDNQRTVTVQSGGFLGFAVPTGSTAFVNNNGVIMVGGSVGTPGAGVELLGSNATFHLGSTSGTGTVTLSDNPANFIEGLTGTETLINDTGHTIQGAVTIAGLTLVNNGAINANGTNPLIIFPFGAVQNNGLLEATGPGGLEVNGDLNIGAPGELLLNSPSATTTVTIIGAVVNSGNVDLASPNATLTTGHLTNFNTVIIGGNGDALIVNGNLDNMASATLTIAGSSVPVSVTGDVNDGGTIIITSDITGSVSGNLNIAPGGSLGLNGSGSFLFVSGAANNSGALTYGGSNNALAVIQNFINLSGGSVNLGGSNNSLSVSGNLNDASGSSFTVSGVNDNVSIGGAVNNSGNLFLTGSGDTVTITGPSTNGGDISLGGSTVFNANGGYTQTGGSTDVAGILNTTTLQLNGGTTTVHAGGLLSSTDFNANGGGIAITTGGTVNVTNTTINNNTITVTDPGSSLKTGSLTNGTGGGIFVENGASLTVTSSTINNNTITVTGNGSSLKTDSLTNGTGGGIFDTNGATLTVTNSTINNNTITVTGNGSSLMTGSLTNGTGGGIFIDNGASLTVPNIILNNNMITAGGTGSSLSAGAIDNNGTVDVNGTNDTLSVTNFTNGFTVTGALFHLDGTGNSYTGGTFVNNGTLGLTGTNDTFKAATTTNNGGIFLSGMNNTLDTGMLTNNSAITVDGTNDTLKTDLTNSGALNLTGSSNTLTDLGDFNNNSGGSLTVGGMSNTVTVLGNFNNAGGAALAMNGTNGSTSVAGAFSNAGTVGIGAGNTLNANGGYTQTAGSTDVAGILNTTTFQLNGGTTTVHTGGLLSSTNFNVTGGNVQGMGTIAGPFNVAGGILQPGLPGIPGTLTINGSYLQGPSATLVIDLGGTLAGQFSVLSVSGPASLNGTVDFTAVNGFTPGVGEDFTFLFSSSLSGDFANLTLTNWTCPAHAACTDVFGPNNSLTLEINPTVATPEPGPLLLLGTGLLGLAGYAGKKRLARRSDTPHS